MRPKWCVALMVMHERNLVLKVDKSGCQKSLCMTTRDLEQRGYLKEELWWIFKKNLLVDAALESSSLTQYFDVGISEC